MSDEGIRRNCNEATHPKKSRKRFWWFSQKFRTLPDGPKMFGSYTNTFYFVMGQTFHRLWRHMKTPLVPRVFLSRKRPWQALWLANSWTRDLMFARVFSARRTPWRVQWLAKLWIRDLLFARIFSVPQFWKPRTPSGRGWYENLFGFCSWVSENFRERNLVSRVYHSFCRLSEKPNWLFFWHKDIFISPKTKCLTALFC